MLRSDFEGHAIWDRIDDIRITLDRIRADGEPTDIATVATIEFYADYIATFKSSSGVSSDFFVEEMLARVDGTLATVLTHLKNREEEPASQAALVEARVAIEKAMIDLAPWPRPYAKGVQVQQLTTLYQDLLERQRVDLEALGARHEAFRAALDALKSGAEAAAEAAEARFESLSSDAATKLAELRSDTSTRLGELKSEADSALETINSYEQKIAATTAELRKTTAGLSTQFEEQQTAWQREQVAKFDESFAPHLENIQARLAEANDALERLKAVETDFANLSAAAATDKLAGHFGIEAKSGRRTGFWLYVAGGVLILAAAVPLAFLLLPGALAADATTRWEQLAIRAGIGIVLGSGATVAIRLGSRFLSNANTAKRMELDLKTFGPFLSSVDEEMVAKARLELVDRALARVEPAKEADDSVSMVGLTNVIEAIAKISK